MKLIVEMEMPKVCITKDGYYGNCPMDRVWCIQGNAPSEITMGEAYAEMTENIPSWCPIKGELPDEHGDLIDRDEVKQKMIYYGFRAIDMTATEFCEDELPTVIAAERKDDEQIH